MSSAANGSNGYGHAHANPSANVVSLSMAKALDPADAQMDQIRDLLFGEFKREMDQRIGAIEARLVDLERRLSAARTEDETKRRGMLDDIARGVAALGDHVKQIAKP
jgi:Mg2+ and Co2+ transporter CorA